MLILRAKTALNVAICMIFFNIFLDNGVMNAPKRPILSLVFTVLCFKNDIKGQTLEGLGKHEWLNSHEARINVQRFSM